MLKPCYFIQLSLITCLPISVCVTAWGWQYIVMIVYYLSVSQPEDDSILSWLYISVCVTAWGWQYIVMIVYCLYVSQPEDDSILSWLYIACMCHSLRMTVYWERRSSFHLSSYRATRVRPHLSPALMAYSPINPGKSKYILLHFVCVIYNCKSCI